MGIQHVGTARRAWGTGHANNKNYKQEMKRAKRDMQTSYSKKVYEKWGISSAESQKGAIVDQRCSVENQKGAIAIDFVQQLRPFGSQRNIFELQ